MPPESIRHFASDASVGSGSSVIGGHSCCLFSFLHPYQNCIRGKKREAELIGDAREITRVESYNGLRPSVCCGLKHHVVVGIPQPCPTLFNFRHIEQRKPLLPGRISETIVKRHYFQ